jgi:hypothetical protein
MAKLLDMSRSSFQTIVKNDLKLKPYKKQKVHGLSEAQKPHLFLREFFFAAKDPQPTEQPGLFCFIVRYNLRVELAVKQFQNVFRFMVWGAISKIGKLLPHSTGVTFHRRECQNQLE